MTRLLAIAFLALGAAACGGGGGGGDRLTRAELATRANAICQEFEQKIEALGSPTSIDEIESFADRSAEIAREGRDELRELEPPEELESDYDRLVDTLDEAIEDIERIGEAASDGDEAEVQRIANEADRKDEASDRLANDLGLNDCAQD
jgi:hypothetical protein